MEAGRWRRASVGNATLHPPSSTFLPPMSEIPFDNQQWVEFVNASAGQIPACGVVRGTGVSVVEAGRWLFMVSFIPG